MAFTDFLDLQTAVVELVQRPDIADVFPRLVKMAEVQFNRRVRCREQITTATLTVTSGSATLPTDFQEVIGVYNGAGYEYIAQPVQELQITQNAGYYAILSDTLVTKNDEVLTLQYYAKVPTISASMTDSNWLLQKAPGLYLYGVGVEAAKYVRDAETAQATMPFLEMEYAGLAAEDAQQRYSRARVRMQGVTP